jgi:hypothetical protein
VTDFTERPFDLVTPLCETGAMADQLRLLETQAAEWRLDDRTREAGRKGVEAARAALRAAVPPTGGDEAKAA